ncbi:Isochorismatase family [Oligella ureolytica]|uniref:Isochorismatase family n=1 Tax=Oligella ureolytica TaxID=90244 RepID=A0A378XH20_9BURK|nr:isochorismatase family protein [Oligella ureolytica]QPT39254.1 isochorismatase family protein [Oligella ureolytica]SUA55428.1 Isochorismatase family [Oligella ureolytica]SUA56666.1 Isochorismatase family [Oligella ureolytica]
MRIHSEKSALLIVDVQDSLIPHIDKSEHMVEKVIWLCKLAQRLELPMIVSEHCVDKIGGTNQAVMEMASGAQVFQKRSFSAVRDGIIKRTRLNDKDHIIVCGMESHVCVLQTCLDLLAAGKEVFLVRDAISSRKPSDLELAVERLRQAGAVVVSTEMVAFELMATAEHPSFSTVLKQLIK